MAGRRAGHDQRTPRARRSATGRPTVTISAYISANGRRLAVAALGATRNRMQAPITIAAAIITAAGNAQPRPAARATNTAQAVAAATKNAGSHTATFQPSTFEYVG